MRFFAIVLAAGTGQRLKNKNNIPKQFIKIQDQSILSRSLKNFIEKEKIEKIVLSINADYMDEYNYELNKLDEESKNKICLVNGGNSRAESLHLAMNFLLAYLQKENEVSTDSLCEYHPKDIAVITHDVARPFVSDRIIDEHIERLYEEEILATVVPTTDTIFYVKDKFDSNFRSDTGEAVSISHVINRDFCVNAQTPQSIRLDSYFSIWQEYKERIQKEYSMGTNQEMLKDILFSQVTDLISLINLDQHEVGLVLGETNNFKITTDIDLKLANLILANK